MRQPQLTWKSSYHLAMGIKTKLFQSARSYYISRQCAMHELSLWSGKMNWLMILTRSIITIEKIITNMQVSIKSQHENSMAWIAIADFRWDVAAVYLYEIHTTVDIIQFSIFVNRFFLASIKLPFHFVMKDLGRS